MLKNKRGLGILGKILLVIGILILLIIIIAGITAWQGYNLYKTATAEATKIQGYSEKLMKGDCLQITNIEISANIIKVKAKQTCKNPIIKIIVDRMQQISIKCSNIDDVEKQMQAQLEPIKKICANQTALNSLK